MDLEKDIELFKGVPHFMSLCHRYSGKRLREIGQRSGGSESGVTQVSRRIGANQKNDKEFRKPITKMVKKLRLSNV